MGAEPGYGYGYGRGYGYGGYYGKRSADAEPEADAVAEAEPGYGYRGGYGGYGRGYYGYGKRSAEPGYGYGLWQELRWLWWLRLRQGLRLQGLVITELEEVSC